MLVVAGAAANSEKNDFGSVYRQGNQYHKVFFFLSAVLSSFIHVNTGSGFPHTSE